MTLEQTTRLILAAARVQDLAALRAASKEREAAMATLSSIPPSPGLRNAVAASLAAGEEARRAIRAIKQRLANIEHGFVRALRPIATHRIDCKG